MSIDDAAGLSYRRRGKGLGVIERRYAFRKLATP